MKPWIRTAISFGISFVAFASLPGNAAPLARRPWIAGLWIEVDCRGIPPKLILRTGKSRVAFLLDAVDGLEVSGTANDEPLELPCGEHPPVTVWIEYDQPSASQRGVKGLVRAIHFEPVPSGLKTR